ncbi:MAG: response regulator transcription factor [Acetatifactor sp.]
MYKILIVDDEQAIVSLLSDYLRLNRYEVLVAYDGNEAVKQALKGPDIILLDVNMPGCDGFSVCRKIRDYVTCPIIFLTARIEDSDKIEGFSVGGDDYIVKPFSIEELGARIAAHIRREHRESQVKNVRIFHDLLVDYTLKTVSVNGEPIELAKKEYEIIELLSSHAGQLFDRERIYEIVWGYDAEGNSSVVAEHIRRIRKKLSAVTGREYIDTVWGVGYRWVK